MANKPKVIGPLDWARSWLAQETEPVMKFLATPLDQLDEHASMASYIYGKYALMLTHTEEEYERAKDTRKVFEDRLILHISEQRNPRTQDFYSIAYAQRKMVENPKLQELKDKELKLKYQMLKIKRYLTALEMKSNTIPGKQGLYNRTVELEDRAE